MRRHLVVLPEMDSEMRTSACYAAAYGNHNNQPLPTMTIPPSKQANMADRRACSMTESWGQRMPRTLRASEKACARVDSASTGGEDDDDDAIHSSLRSAGDGNGGDDEAEEEEKNAREATAA